jgi:3-oxoacyl-[acyl-carrier protein] reductase
VPNLDRKVAVIAGSLKGIGASIAERLSKDGASVVGNYSHSAESPLMA